MSRLLSTIDNLNKAAGSLAGGLLLALLAVELLIVLLRYVFNIGFLWMQEGALYLHAVVALVASGYALLRNAHVRVDIFLKQVPVRVRVMVDLIGAVLFLLPLCIIVFRESLPFVAASWSVLEGSSQPSGLPAVFLLKTSLLVFAFLLGLQGAALALRSFICLIKAQSELPDIDLDTGR